MDDLGKAKSRNELTGIQGPRRRFFEAAATEAGKEDGRGLGDEEREVQAESMVEGTPVKLRGGSGGVPDAPRGRHLEMSGTNPAGGPLVKAAPAPPRQRNFVVPNGPPAFPVSMVPQPTVRERRFEMPGAPPAERVLVTQPTVRQRNFMPGASPVDAVLVTEPTVRQRNFEMPCAPPAEGIMVSGFDSHNPTGTPDSGLQDFPMPAPEGLGLPRPKVRTRKFETAGVLPPAGRPTVVPTTYLQPVNSSTVDSTQRGQQPGDHAPHATLRRRHLESPIVPAEPGMAPPSELNVPPPPAGVISPDGALHPGPRRRDFVMAEGSQMPTIGKSVEPRTLQDIEASPDSGVEVPIGIFVDQLINDSRPIDAKLKYYTPPPEAQRLMVRNIARRHNGATHPLEGYYSPKDPSNIHFDNTQYPDDFVPPLISLWQYHTEDQLKNVHWKVETADYNTSTYQEKLHFVKGARLTQLEWELNNINLLGEIGKELQECKDELLPFVLQ